MPNEQSTAVAKPAEKGDDNLGLLLPTRGSPALHIMLNERLFDRCRMVAGYMAKAEGMIPRHLLGKPEACFAVLCRAMTWKLDPYAVALCTHQTPGGQVGFEGKLCQAILENSGKLEGPVKFEHYGSVTVRYPDKTERIFRSNDPELEEAFKAGATKIGEMRWSNVQNKFEIKRSDKSGKEYAVPTWTNRDAEGLGVTVRAKVQGEVELRKHDFDLIQAFPRNSTLWALDPKTQICYTAVRRFANVAAPGLFMGVPFDREDDLHYGFEHAKDVTPRPSRADYDPESGKTARQHYAEKAEAEREAQMEQELAGATTGQMPDTPEERGEIEESTEEGAQDGQEKPAGAHKEPELPGTGGEEKVAQGPANGQQQGDFVADMMAKFGRTRSLKTLETAWAEAGPEINELSDADYDRLNLAYEARKQELRNA